MMNYRARRGLIVLMTVCLALLVLLCARRSVNNAMKLEQKYPTKNPDILLKTEDDGSLWITGEGELYDSDLKRMLQMASISNKAITDIIVGDGITEIGYNAFSGHAFLKTLKLGKGIRRIAPGGIKNCKSLEYVFLPDGLRDIGLDFLYDCGKCRVITDAKADDLPAMMNVEEDTRVITEVDSWEALLAACDDSKTLPSSLANWWQ